MGSIFLAYILNVRNIAVSSYVNDNRYSVVGVTTVIMWGLGLLFFRCCLYLSVNNMIVSL